MELIKYYREENKHYIDMERYFTLNIKLIIGYDEFIKYRKEMIESADERKFYFVSLPVYCNTRSFGEEKRNFLKYLLLRYNDCIVYHKRNCD